MPSIRTFIQNLNNYGIPEFQRDFEWDREKIEKFWDSVYRRYPLPIFFMWQVGENSPVGLTRFTSEFKNCKPILEEIQGFNDAEYGVHTTAVCDGQQRLTTIIIGIKGLNLGSPKSPKYLYFNPFTEILNGQTVLNQNSSYFKVLLEKGVAKKNNIKAGVEPTEYWIKFKDFYEFLIAEENKGNIDSATIIESYISYIFSGISLGINTRQRLFSTFHLLYSQLSNADYLNFTELSNIIQNNLEKADEFFIRINNGAAMKPDSKLFALLTRFIPADSNINLKTNFSEIEVRYRDHFSQKIKPNFFLRTCLYIITDSVLFNVDSFNRSNCTIIINSWGNIKHAITTTFEIIIELGLSKCIHSLNSTIPIAYHIFKKRSLDENYEISPEEKREILRYFIRSEISGYFGGEHGDSKLRRIKENQNTIEYNAGTIFELNILIQNLPENESFDINDLKIEKALNSEYGASICRPLLHLIYPTLNSTVDYELDHIHPKSKCSNKEELADLGFNQINIDFIHSTFNKIANLQLIPRRFNRNKLDKNIFDWVTERINANDWISLNNQRTHEDYYRSNFIESANNSFQDYLNLSNYTEYYRNRHEKLKSRLTDILNNI